uniref:Uncharacterized protein n=1 Tax=Alexandrium monilatum TaxID=311494 RepID=A0A7S4R705_9DINO
MQQQQQLQHHHHMPPPLSGHCRPQGPRPEQGGDWMQQELRRTLELDALHSQEEAVWRRNQEEAFRRQQQELEQLRRRAAEAEHLHRQAEELRRQAEADRQQAEVARREAEDLWRRVEESKRPEEETPEAPAAPGGVFMRWKRPGPGQKADTAHRYEEMVVETGETPAAGGAAKQVEAAEEPGGLFSSAKSLLAASKAGAAEEQGGLFSSAKSLLAAPKVEAAEEPGGLFSSAKSLLAASKADKAEEQGGLFSSAKSLLAAPKDHPGQGGGLSNAKASTDEVAKGNDQDHGSLPHDAGGSLLPGVRDETLAGPGLAEFDDSMPLFGPEARAPFRAPRPAGRAATSTAAPASLASADSIPLDDEPSLLGPAARKQFKRPRLAAPPAGRAGRAGAAALPGADETCGREPFQTVPAPYVEVAGTSCAAAVARASGPPAAAAASEGVAVGGSGVCSAGTLQRTASIGFL